MSSKDKISPEEVAARRRRIKTLRLFIQILVLLIINAQIFGAADTGFPVPVLYPAGAPYTVMVGAYYAFEKTMTSGALPFLALGVIFLITVISGRAFCGWACPFGLAQDVVGSAPTKKKRPDRITNKDLQFFAQLFLFMSIIIGLYVGWKTYQGTNADVREGLGVFSDAPFAVYSPAATLFATLPYMIGWYPDYEDPIAFTDFGFIFWLRLLFLIAILYTVAYVPRAFCRWFCPLGLIMGECGKYSLIGLSRNPARCDKCGDCEKVCPMGVRILDYPYERVSDTYCILCMDCVAACPKDALEITFNVPKKSAEEK